VSRENVADANVSDISTYGLEYRLQNYS